METSKRSHLSTDNLNKGFNKGTPSSHFENLSTLSGASESDYGDDDDFLNGYDDDVSVVILLFLLIQLILSKKKML